MRSLVRIRGARLVFVESKQFSVLIVLWGTASEEDTRSFRSSPLAYLSEAPPVYHEGISVFRRRPWLCKPQQPPKLVKHCFCGVNPSLNEVARQEGGNKRHNLPHVLAGMIGDKAACKTIPQTLLILQNGGASHLLKVNKQASAGCCVTATAVRATAFFMRFINIEVNTSAARNAR